MKRIISIGLTLVLLVCLTSAYAGSAGSASDPLVTKTWVDGTYTNNVISSGEKTVDNALEKIYDAALSAVTSEYEKYASYGGAGSAYDFASGYDALAMSSGSSVNMVTGGSFLLVSGSAAVTINRGAVINVSTGQEVATGTSLAKNQRYFCAEDTEAVFKASSASVAAVNGSYIPSSGVTLQENAYTDVSAADWFYSAVMYVKEKELFYDINASAFRPRANTDRATLVYSMWKAAGAPAASSTSSFRDLTDNWYKQAVAWAAENEIVKGYGDGRFGPSDTITREQIAVFMYRFADYLKYSVTSTSNLSSYTDKDSISSWALTEMRWANAAGLITGTTTTTLSPQGTATRSEVATIIMRFLEN